jgi:hypothetical protein
MTFAFKDAPETACIVCQHVLDGKNPITFISHDKEDGMWQFLCSEDHILEDVRLISLAEAFQIDESIGQVADLPRGFVTERTEAKGRWKAYSSSAVES